MSERENNDNQWENISIKDHIVLYINNGMRKKDAVKKVAEDRKLPKREVYDHSIDI